jgi:integrase
MASIHTHPNNGNHIVRWRENKKQKHKSCGPGDAGLKEAERFAAEIEARLEHQKKSLLDTLSVEVVYFDELAVHYFQADALKTPKRWKIDWKKLLNDHLLEDLGQAPMDQLNEGFITALVIQKFPEATSVTHSTYLAYLKAMFNFGIQRGYIDKNPLRFVTKKTSPQKDLLLDLKMIQKIKDAAPDHLALAVELLSSTGVRPGPSELLALRYNHIQWDQGVLRVFAGKTGKWRTIPLKPALLEKLRTRMKYSKSGYLIEYKGKPVKSIHRSFRRTCETLKIDKSVVMYDIRHWYCTSLLSAGVPVKTVSMLMGHSSAKMTLDRYAHVIITDTAKAIEHLPDLD